MLNVDTVRDRFRKAADSPTIENIQTYWSALAKALKHDLRFTDAIQLATLRKKAEKQNLIPINRTKLRVAVTGGYSTYPLAELLALYFASQGFEIEIFQGEFDNYVSEILEADSELYAFKPDFLILIPPERLARYSGSLLDSRDLVHNQALALSNQLLSLCATFHERTGNQVVLSNFAPTGFRDLGHYRVRTAASEWGFRRLVNTELGHSASSFTLICDLEFIASGLGLKASRDWRGWFESKQLGSPQLLVHLAKELSQIVVSSRRAMKKVLVLDMDNTLYGGVIGDDGLDGIDIGDISSRGQAFKAFQQAILSVKNRGVLLAVSSKNDHSNAVAVFEKHPEMVLRKDDFVSIKANWEPKSENIRQIAAELNLGLDSFVFIDDNPAEIEVVNKFVPEVATILLTDDPADYVGQLLDSSYFEPTALTVEDFQRTELYQTEAKRSIPLSSITDMNEYLASLEMKAHFQEFTSVDAPRISQLINKSNQFNLTTKRRSEAEVLQLIHHPDYLNFSVRLADKFGDYGLISVIILQKLADTLHIDTWLMSCRVLKRQVEEQVTNEIVRLAKTTGAAKVSGKYIPTEKNQMVETLLPRMGFSNANGSDHSYELFINGTSPFKTQIFIARSAYESN